MLGPMGVGSRRILVAVALASALGIVAQASSADGPPLSNGPDTALPPDASVFVVPVQGGVARLVTPGQELAFDPEWRPGTRSLVVVTEGGVVELRARAGLPSWERRRTLHREVVWSPSFSPDGTKLAFVGGFPSDIEILTLATGAIRHVTRSWHADGFVDWAASGRELAVTRRGSILRMGLNGRVLQTLLPEPSTCFGPAWAPRGGRVAFACLSPDLSVHLGSPRLGTYTSLTNGEPPSAFPAWSPDGGQLAYSKFVDGSWDLFVRDVKTRRERRLLRTPYDELDPAWSPDGRLLAYVSNAP
jgi:Tol biopolymer transport system component